MGVLPAKNKFSLPLRMLNSLFSPNAKTEQKKPKPQKTGNKQFSEILTHNLKQIKLAKYTLAVEWFWYELWSIWKILKEQILKKDWSNQASKDYF